MPCSVLALDNSQEMYTLAERRKNEHDPTVYPVMRRLHDDQAQQRPGLHQKLVDPWLEGHGYR